MKKSESNYKKENTKNCFECIHFDAYEKYKKYDTYTVDDFKEVLIEMVNNCNNARHLLIIHSVFKLLEECKCQ